MTPSTGDLDAYVRRETAISIAINAALSLAFFLAIFGLDRPIPPWGVGGWVFDFMPQGFMIALMSVLVPGIIAGRKLRSGRLVATPSSSLLPRHLVARAILLAITSALAGSALVATFVWIGGVQMLTPLAALLFKVGYGAGLAAIITPPSLRTALSAPRP
ncbi:hypothetical protein [Sphingobium sp.]|uniref:hypothetical protein n=1 Tax=Sphingobium sp. TaxID=1912891 RepID=UPI002C9F44E9|nr:hypothetical protein [Sphingobium sp.]HUD94686.1 hypothetical protein [Sphingobium sp.]